MQTAGRVAKGEEYENYQHIKVNPTAIALAAEIEGVDLSQPLNDKTLHE